MPNSEERWINKSAAERGSSDALPADGTTDQPNGPTSHDEMGPEYSDDDQPTDRNLIGKAQAYLKCRLDGEEPGDEFLTEWEQFYRDYDPMLRRFVAGWGIMEPDRDDCVQESWQRLLEAFAEFDNLCERGRFRDWLFQIVNHTVKDFERRRRRQDRRDRLAAAAGVRQVESDPASSAQNHEEAQSSPMAHSNRSFIVPEPSRTPLPVANHNNRDQVLGLLRWALLSLRPRLTVTGYCILCLRFLEGQTVEQIASTLDLDPRQVIVQQSRALERLRTHFALYAPDEESRPGQ